MQVFIKIKVGDSFETLEELPGDSPLFNIGDQLYFPAKNEGYEIVSRDWSILSNKTIDPLIYVVKKTS